MKLHPQIIEKDGKSEFVVLPIDEFQALKAMLEEYEDLRDLREAKAVSGSDEGISISDAKRLLGL